MINEIKVDGESLSRDLEVVALPASVSERVPDDDEAITKLEGNCAMQAASTPAIEVISTLSACASAKRAHAVPVNAGTPADPVIAHVAQGQITAIGIYNVPHSSKLSATQQLLASVEGK
ncbi:MULTISPECIES: hypothetical protein [Paraburkholderia]|uniref:hypothetical protein n=1 Tax=Paraburkholderia TaxID=1822464 RepID=UPI002253B8AE|nr:MULTISPECIES: hypothetical protein [Paraburkholderia]MCX4165126.1 hypothetical protein [Paraburkholderia megapolitana]MDN7160619.1 hypothetical protein [Paraburkholderia sp. CHISQ3]MDQ6497666.1 hypothetical protein [Paraburkholderia megapolitana]